MYPLWIKRVAPFFIGKDARDLEELLWEVYRHQSNYKFCILHPISRTRDLSRNSKARPAFHSPVTRRRWCAGTAASAVPPDRGLESGLTPTMRENLGLSGMSDDAEERLLGSRSLWMGTRLIPTQPG